MVLTRTKNVRGFTLIELLVVIAIIGTLRGYPVIFPCNSRYLNGGPFLDSLGFNSLSMR